MKPKNWRTYYWYKRPSLSAKVPSRISARQAEDFYVQWLAKQRGWSEKEARNYALSQSAQTIISAHFG